MPALASDNELGEFASLIPSSPMDQAATAELGDFASLLPQDTSHTSETQKAVLEVPDPVKLAEAKKIAEESAPWWKQLAQIPVAAGTTIERGLADSLRAVGYLSHLTGYIDPAVASATPEERAKQLREHPLTQAADALEAFSHKDEFIGDDQRLKGGWGEKVGGVTGSVLDVVAEIASGRAALAPLKLSRRAMNLAPAGTVFAGKGGAAGLRSAEESEADESETLKLFLADAAVGAATGVLTPANRWIERLEAGTGGGFSTAIKRAVLEGGQNALQMLGMTLGEAYADKAILDKDRDLAADLKASVTEGGVVGAVASLVVSSLSKRAPRARSAPEPAETRVVPESWESETVTIQTEPPANPRARPTGEEPADPKTPAPVVAPDPVEGADSLLPGDKFPAIEMPIDDLVLSKEVPNFKGEADPETGVVEGRQLKGKLQRFGLAPIQVWVRLDGRREVISGRHRLDLARRNGEATLPQQQVFEADGFTAADAARLDAEINIRDGQGEVRDYAAFFRNSNIPRDEAAARSLLSRREGRAGYALGNDASPDVYALYLDGKLPERAAVEIAEAAPGDTTLQRAGVDFVKKGGKTEQVRHFVQSLNELRQDPNFGKTIDQGDLFGTDDTALAAAKKMAEAAVELQKEAGRDVAILRQAKTKQSALELTDPEAARLGILDKKNLVQINVALERARASADRWNSWAQNPDLAKLVRERAQVKLSETPVISERPEDLTTGDKLNREALQEYLDDAGVEWPEGLDRAQFRRVDIRLEDLTQARRRPLPSLDDVDMKMVGQTRSIGEPLLIDSDFSVIDGMHRVADKIWAGDRVIDAWQRIEPKEPIGVAAAIEEIQRRNAPDPGTLLDAEAPKLRPGEKQGDLLSTQTEDFKLVGEKGTDFEAQQKETARLESERKAAEAAQAKQQGALFDQSSGGKPPPNRVEKMRDGIFGEEGWFITSPSPKKGGGWTYLKTHLTPYATEAEALTAAGLSKGKGARAPRGAEPSKITKGAEGEVPPIDTGTAATAATRPIGPFQGPEMIRLVTALAGAVPGVKRLRPGLRGFFKPGGGTAGIGEIIVAAANKPRQLARTLAHEMGHLLDYLDDKTMTRGNIIGRIISASPIVSKGGKLRGFLIGTFGPLNNRELKRELMALSEWWRPYDKANAPKQFIKYRESSKELYADAVSVLLNAPRELKSRAPKFFEAFFSNLDKKPDVRQAYFDLQDLINGKHEDIIALRRADIREGQSRAEEVAFKLLTEKEAAEQSIIESVQQALIDSAMPVINAEKKLFPGRLVDESRTASFALDELRNKDNAFHVWLSKLEDRIVQPLLKAGVTMEDMGEYLLLRRIVNERTDIANPWGHTPETAADTLAGLKAELGDAKVEVLEQKMRLFDEAVYDLQGKAMREGVINKTTFDETITPNLGNYATFATVDGLTGDSLHATIKQQIGTFKPVMNTFVATVMKAHAMARLTELQKAKRAVVIRMARSFPDQIKKVNFAPGGKIPAPEKGKDNLLMLDNGRLVAFEVPKAIGDVFKTSDIGAIKRWADFAQSKVYSIFHPLFVTYNPGFGVFNLQRDLRRTWVNLGSLTGASVRDVLKAYWDSKGAAWRQARGIRDAEITRLLEEKALGVPFVKTIEDATIYKRMLRKTGLSVGEGARGLGGIELESKTAALRFLEWFPKAAEAFNTWSETLPKLASYKILQEQGKYSPRERAYIVRNIVGTPNYRRKGNVTRLTNGVFMYSNVMVQGLRVDLELAKHPETAAGYWQRRIAADAVPKVLMRLAVLGAFGGTVKAMMDLIPDYDKANFIVIPVGTTTDNSGNVKARYFRFPHDETGRWVSGLLWKTLQENHDMKSLMDIVNFNFSQVPGVNPALSMAGKWKTFVRGDNPYDDFRRRDVVSREAWEAGGWYATSEMLSWTADQFGIVSELAHPIFRGRDESSSETVLRSLPAINRVLKESDRGLKESEWAEVELEESERQRLKLELGKKTRATVKERYRLNRLGPERLSEKENARRIRVNEWYKRYLDTSKGIDTAIGENDDARVKQLRKELEESAATLY